MKIQSNAVAIHSYDNCKMVGKRNTKSVHYFKVGILVESCQAPQLFCYRVTNHPEIEAHVFPFPQEKMQGENQEKTLPLRFLMKLKV